MTAKRRCVFRNVFAGNVRCERAADGVVVVVQDNPLKPWPDDLTGDHCIGHGRSILRQVDRLDPKVKLSWRSLTP